MFYRKIILCIATAFLFSCAKETQLHSFTTNHFKISIDDTGQIHTLEDIKNATNYISKDSDATLLSLQVDSTSHRPTTVSYNNGLLTLNYPEQITATVKVLEKESHITFELVTITNNEAVALIQWGPIPTTIKKSIGETVGVVRGETFGIGIQALNPKTLGGLPWNPDDTMPQLDIFSQDDYSDLSEEGKGLTLYRVEAAKPETFGSTLQAYCRNRFKERVIPAMGHEYYTSPAVKDNGVIGSKIALFGCPVDETLQTLGKIELAEDLPHPMINKQWGKLAKSASSAYLILDFSEATIEEAIAYTKEAGLDYLYHPGPFKNWGHFELEESSFPNGWDGLKACVDKAKKQGIHIGVHTLSNFLTTDDPYVSPVPDPRLAKVGTTSITSAITKTQTEIPIAAPLFFSQYEKNNLHTARIGDELISYEKVSATAPWKLLGCERGAWNTTALPHEAETAIDKLADHAYKVFLTNKELSEEMAQNLAALYNHTGLRQVSFDGLEGNHSTGLGNYGENIFTNAWWDALNDDIKQHTIIDASRTSHYFWHMYSRMNWGEPWYAGFRESQTEYRLKNQPYFERNLMPAMLGWFSLQANTPIEDIEWMLARSAGFNAGYAFVVKKDILENNGHTTPILKAVGAWEKARMASAFNESQKERMQNINHEFHLETISDRQWKLFEINKFTVNHLAKTRQPGEPLFSEFKFKTSADNSQLQFILTAKDAAISNVKLVLNKTRNIPIPVTIAAGQSVRYYGGNKAIVHDANLHVIQEISMDAALFELEKGSHSVLIDCEFANKKDDPVARLELRIPDEGTLLNAK